MTPTPGLLIAFEGGEGAGKSTQVAALAKSLRAAGREVLETHEPGATAVGLAIRALLLDPATLDLSPRAEALLYAADRAQHVDRQILPALSAGWVVITDRYVDSSLAYQGAGRPLDPAQVEAVNDWATGGLRPDLTVLLDLDPAVGLGRTGDRDRLEAEPLAFHRAVRAGFLALASRDPQRYVVLDATQDPDLVSKQVTGAVAERLGLLGLRP